VFPQSHACHVEVCSTWEEPHKIFAVHRYTAALDLLSKEQPRTYPGYDQLQHALLSNRSAAYTSAGRWKEGWADAVSLQACSPGWSKAWYRGGRAAEEGRQHVPALLQYAHAHQLCKGAGNTSTGYIQPASMVYIAARCGLTDLLSGPQCYSLLRSKGLAGHACA
jgi:hypothetical protein